jgi:environmental stress-induced protein Ves
MMISCLWYIKIQIAFSAESAHNFVQYDVEAAPHVAAFMAYAFQADSHTRSRGTQTDLIDQLNDLITKYDMERHWLYDLRPYLQGRCKLLGLSTLSYSYLGCYEDVRDRLKMLDETQRSHRHFTASFHFEGE